MENLLTTGKSSTTRRVEKIEEAIKALEYPNLQSVQTSSISFVSAQQNGSSPCPGKKAAILAWVPLASGLLTGKYQGTTFGIRTTVNTTRRVKPLM